MISRGNGLCQQESSRNEPGVAEICYILFVLVFFAVRGVWPIIEQPLVNQQWGFLDPQSHVSNPLVHRTSLIILFGGTSWFFLKAYRPALQSICRMRLMAGIPLLALASTVWSDDRARTFVSSGMLVVQTLFSFYFATRLRQRTQLKLLMLTGCSLALASVAFALLIPSFGVDHSHHEGAWQGIFTQKNVLARVMVFMIAPAVAYLSVRGRQRLSHWLYVAFLAAMTIMSRAITGIFILLLYVPLSLCLRTLAIFTLRSRRAIFLLGCVAVACMAWFARSNSQWLLDEMGRDQSLTGRTDIWKLSLEAVSKRPLLGYGYDAFWGSLNGPSHSIILALHWAVPGAHNGFVDVSLSLGLLGAGLVIWSIVSASIHAAFAYNFNRSPYTLFCMLIIVVTVVYSLDEGFLTQHNQLLWALYVIACVGISDANQHLRTRDNTVQLNFEHIHQQSLTSVS